MDIELLSDILRVNIFTPSKSHFFTSLAIFFESRSFKFKEVHTVIIFLSLPVHLVSYPGTHCQLQCCEAFRCGFF
jgi:hypothetical protein